MEEILKSIGAVALGFLIGHFILAPAILYWLGYLNG